MMRIGRGTTSYLDEQPFDRQSQCTRIPWSMLAGSKTQVRHWHEWARNGRINGQPDLLSQCEASTVAESLGSP